MRLTRKYKSINAERKLHQAKAKGKSVGLYRIYVGII